MKNKRVRRRLNKANKKIWHSEKIKEKLNNTLTELKKQSLIDEKLSNELEVCSRTIILIAENIHANKNYYEFRI